MNYGSNISLLGIIKDSCVKMHSDSKAFKKQNKTKHCFLHVALSIPYTGQEEDWSPLLIEYNPQTGSD